MLEYVFYVLIIFLPIGGVMTYLLRKEGLVTRDIAVIVLVSLFIIISFPFSVERIGSHISLGFYVFVLLLMSVYIFKSLEKSCFATEERNKSNLGENSPSVNCYLDNSSEKSAIEEILEGAASDYNSDINPRAIEVVGKKPEEVDTRSGLGQKNEIGLHDEKLYAGEKGKAGDDVKDHLGNDVDVVNFVSADVADDLQVKKQIWEEVRGEVPDVNNEDNKVFELLEKAFSCKERDNLQQAAGYFRQAWEITHESELKYILTMELLSIYKGLGWYGEAEDILERYIAFGEGTPEIREEINNQVCYIKLITQELERLGIGDIPLSRVPRLVRIRVAERMELQ